MKGSCEHKNILNRQSWTDDKGSLLAWRMGKGLTTVHCKKPPCYEMLHRVSELAGSCEHSNNLSRFLKKWGIS
jgi:hypothetical protein